jgi:hypothetical protein
MLVPQEGQPQLQSIVVVLRPMPSQYAEQYLLPSSAGQVQTLLAHLFSSRSSAIAGSP